MTDWRLVALTVTGRGATPSVTMNYSGDGRLESSAIKGVRALGIKGSDPLIRDDVCPDRPRQPPVGYGFLASTMYSPPT